jgi:hypothetical protein
MADPEEYRTREQVEAWRQRDPIAVFSGRLQEAGVLSSGEAEELDREAIERVDRAVEFAEASEFPSPESLYDNVYVLGDQVRGWYSMDARTPTPHRGEDERGMPAEDLADTEYYDRALSAPPEAGPADDAQDREQPPGAEPSLPVEEPAEHDAVSHRGET